MKLREVFQISAIPVVVASLCCLSPIIFVALGLGTVSFAASLADTLYGEYKWVFRGIGFLLLMISVVFYFRKKNVCTLDQAKRKRNEIINTVLIVLVVGVLGYLFFLYGVVHYLGVWMHIWE